MITVLNIDKWLNVQCDVIIKSPAGGIQRVRRIKDGVIYNIGQVLWKERFTKGKGAVEHVLISYIKHFDEDRKHVEIHNKLIDQELARAIRSYGEEPWEINDLPDSMIDT